MLEALSFGLPVIASGIPANLEVGLKKEQYFPLGNVAMLASLLRNVATQGAFSKHPDEIRRWVAERYNWENIARQTFDVYRRVLLPS